MTEKELFELLGYRYDPKKKRHELLGGFAPYSGEGKNNQERYLTRNQFLTVVNFLKPEVYKDLIDNVYDDSKYTSKRLIQT